VAKRAEKKVVAVARRARSSLPRDLVKLLVSANHILFHQRIVDAFGHVSVRHADKPDRFLLARSMAPILVTPADILEFDLDGRAVDSTASVYLERFIHSEIYRLRPDVQAVIHSHSQAVIPFGVVQGTPLRPIFHMSAFLGEGCPIFEIRNTAGNGSDLLIRSSELGQALAKDLGAGPAILMRGHGATIVADSLQRAVFRAVYLQMNAELQARAMQFGAVNYLTPEEVRSAMNSVEGQLGRAWDMWRMMAEGEIGS